MRAINAIFEIQADSDIVGVRFECNGRTLDWDDLTRMEQIRMLNGWAAEHRLFYNSVKQED